jgi:signal transduction histidine kinase
MSVHTFSRKPHILVVDDEPDNFDVIEGFLFTEGYQLSYLSSAQKALTRLESHQPDLILLDAMMPIMDGFSFCRQVKQNPEWQHIPIIMITALGADYLETCLTSGADDFLAKPMNKIELKARVVSMLRIKFQYDALKKSLEFRNDLTNMVVHDFVNPLSSILLQSEVLQKLDLAPNVERGVQRIQRSASRLEGLTQDLLVYAKAEAGVLVLHRTAFVLRDWLRDAVADFEELAEVRNIVVRIQSVVDLEFVGDRPLLSRMLNNLLANAFKFSPFHGQIDLEIGQLTNQAGELLIQLTVKDQGNGVPDELKERIFQKYEIGKKQVKVAQTGLGLAFCKMVVEAHKGLIYVVDNEPRGSVFVVELPLAPPTLAPLAQDIK